MRPKTAMLAAGLSTGAVAVQAFCERDRGRPPSRASDEAGLRLGLKP